MSPRIGDYVKYGGAKWLVVDIHGYPIRTVDLNLTVVKDPNRQYLNETWCRRNIPVSEVAAVDAEESKHGHQGND